MSSQINSSHISINKSFPDAYWSLPGSRLYLGDVRYNLHRMPARSIQSVVTSPPYWNLRDYGVCECATLISGYRGYDDDMPGSSTSTLGSGGNIEIKPASPNCIRCKGTGRTLNKDLQIGAEPSPDCLIYGQAQCGNCFVCSMVSVFRELKRVLRDDGVAWLNLGDTYADSGDIVPKGNLIGVPWRVALALQADGWILRQDVIWHKPNPMPESVTNRCTKSHEYIFMLTKSEDYYFDSNIISEKSSNINHVPPSKKYAEHSSVIGGKQGNQGLHKPIGSRDGSSNKRSVWSVTTANSFDAHFAVFSPELITPCILSSTSEHGCCAECNKPWERVTVKTDGVVKDNAFDRDKSLRKNRNGKDGSTMDGTIPTRKTIGWRQVCGCKTNKVVPCIVLDPFVGSGTTVVTSVQLGRNAIGIDVSETYLNDITIPRVKVSILGGRIEKKPTESIPVGTLPEIKKLRGT